jgi:DNA-binding NarL/FixJ family response regulator
MQEGQDRDVVADPTGAPGRPIRVLIADDHARVRAGLSGLLAAREDIEVVGVATNGAEAVAMAVGLAPEVILMDVSMPVLDGIEATRQIVAANPRLRVVILTALHGRREDALRAGAAGHVLKDASPEELVRCLRLTAAT